MTLICIPLRARTLSQLKKMMRKAEKEADVIEVWVDPLARKVKPREILQESRKPIIIVNKDRKEKGLFRGTEKEKIAILEEYVKAGADYIDVPLGTSRNLLKKLVSGKKKTKIILSHHDFRETPSLGELRKIRDKGFALGADIVKIATYARKAADNHKILDLLSGSGRRKPLIALCMGKLGIVSRTLAPKCGSYIIYLALDPRHRTAPGQLTAGQYKKISSLSNHENRNRRTS